MLEEVCPPSGKLAAGLEFGARLGSGQVGVGLLDIGSAEAAEHLVLLLAILLLPPFRTWGGSGTGASLPTAAAPTSLGWINKCCCGF